MVYVFRDDAEQGREVGRGDLPIKLIPSSVVQDQMDSVRWQAFH
jgi:hypothetical protein